MLEYSLQRSHPLGQVFESFLRGLRVRGGELSGSGLPAAHSSVYRFLHRGVRVNDRQTPAECGMRAGGTYRIDAMVEPVCPLESATGTRLIRQTGGGGGVSR